MKFLEWGGRYLYHLTGVQTLTNRVSSDRTNPRIKRFFQKSPVPIEADPYKALEIFWGYNFWQRHQHFKKKIPVLIITGGKDPSFTQEMGTELANSFPLGQH